MKGFRLPVTSSNKVSVKKCCAHEKPQKNDHMGPLEDLPWGIAAWLSAPSFSTVATKLNDILNTFFSLILF